MSISDLQQVAGYEMFIAFLDLVMPVFLEHLQRCVDLAAPNIELKMFQEYFRRDMGTQYSGLLHLIMGQISRYTSSTYTIPSPY